MKVLVVGFGSIGSRHAVNAKAFGHEVYVFDNAKTEREIRTMFANAKVVTEVTPSDYDAIVVATPANQHAEAFAYAAERPVLFEKPLALTREEAQACPKNQIIRVGYNLRFHPAYRYAFEAIRELGGIASASFIIHCDKSKWPGMRYENMLIEGSHEIDLALWMLGPAEVRGVVKTAEDLWTILLEHTQNGAASTIVLDGVHQNGYKRLANITGEQGAVSLTWNGPELNWQWSAIKTGAKMQSARTMPDDTYREELREFLAVVARGVNDNAGVCSMPGEAVAVLEICDAATAASERT